MSKYSEKFKDPKWQKKRLEVLERDEWLCQICMDDESTLHVHHKYYIKGNDPWDYPLDAFITLCDQCHEYEHNERPGSEQDLLSMLKRCGFMADDIHEIASGFNSMQTTTITAVTASIINWALSNEEVMVDLTHAYFESLREVKHG